MPIEVNICKRPSSLKEQDMLEWFYGLPEDSKCYFKITGGQYKNSIGIIERSKIKMVRSKISRGFDSQLNYHYSCQQSLFLSFNNRKEILKINSKYFMFLGTDRTEEILIYKGNVLHNMVDMLGQNPEMGQYVVFSKNNKVHVGTIIDSTNKYMIINDITDDTKRKIRVHNGQYLILSEDINDLIAGHLLAYGKIISPIEIETYSQLEQMVN